MLVASDDDGADLCAKHSTEKEIAMDASLLREWIVESSVASHDRAQDQTKQSILIGLNPTAYDALYNPAPLPRGAGNGP